MHSDGELPLAWGRCQRLSLNHSDKQQGERYDGDRVPRLRVSREVTLEGPAPRSLGATVSLIGHFLSTQPPSFLGCPERHTLFPETPRPWGDAIQASQTGCTCSGRCSRGGGGNRENTPVITPLTVLFASSSKIIISSALSFFGLAERVPASAESQFTRPLPAAPGLRSCAVGWAALSVLPGGKD